MNKESNVELDIVKLPCAIEAALDVTAQLFGLCIVYWVFHKIGVRLIGEEFSPDVLLSLVVLPAIYILKDSHVIIEPYFVSVWLKNDTVTVKRGFLTTWEDSLSLNNVENIEIVTSFLGRFQNYGSLRVYAYGSWVEIPFIKDAPSLKVRIETIKKEKTF